MNRYIKKECVCFWVVDFFLLGWCQFFLEKLSLLACVSEFPFFLSIIFFSNAPHDACVYIIVFFVLFGELKLIIGWVSLCYFLRYRRFRLFRFSFYVWRLKHNRPTEIDLKLRNRLFSPTAFIFIQSKPSRRSVPVCHLRMALAAGGVITTGWGSLICVE